MPEGTPWAPRSRAAALSRQHVRILLRMDLSSLPEEVKDLVRAQIEAGRFSSVDEVVCEALRLLHEREELFASPHDVLRSQIAECVAAEERGELRDGDEAIAAVGFLCVGRPANAGVITFFTDRPAWVTAATNAGLTVTTDAFSTAPPAYPDLTVGGIDFSIGIRAGIPFDAVNERIGYISGGGRTLSLDYTGGSLMLFGFGVDLGPTVGNVGTTDIDGVDIAPSLSLALA